MLLLARLGACRLFLSKCAECAMACGDEVPALSGCLRLQHTRQNAVMLMADGRWPIEVGAEGNAEVGGKCAADDEAGHESISLG